MEYKRSYETLTKEQRRNIDRKLSQYRASKLLRSGSKRFDMESKLAKDDNIFNSAAKAVTGKYNPVTYVANIRRRAQGKSEVNNLVELHGERNAKRAEKWKAGHAKLKNALGDDYDLIRSHRGSKKELRDKLAQKYHGI